VFGHRLFIEGYPVVKKYIPPDAKTILDVGGGTGRYAIKFAQDRPDAKVYATDLLPSSLEVMRSIARQAGVTSVEFKQEDVTSLSFPDNHFDLVYCGMLLQILPDVDTAMREMRRVLKPGGTLIVTTVNVWNFHTINKKIRELLNMPEYYITEKARTPREMRRLFNKHGVRVLASDGFYPAYGIFRLRAYWKPASLIGRVLNRLNRIVDRWTGRFLSRHFGFEILVVGTK
jgi:ubiquinone/menaquinone biosynthesis C-methylase UbiE